MLQALVRIAALGAEGGQAAAQRKDGEDVDVGARVALVVDEGLVREAAGRRARHAERVQLFENGIDAAFDASPFGIQLLHARLGVLRCRFWRSKLVLR